MRGWTLLVTAAALVALAAAAARRPDQDFEFDDEADAPGTETGHSRRSRRYIYDPHNSLCQSLVCKRREVCLLRDAFTALCANKKEILRKGDVIVAANSNSASSSEEDDSLEGGEEGEDGVGWGRADDEDVFYDAAAEQDDADVTDRCVGCPVRARASFLCGSDNRTYSSLCRLDLHNCVRRAARPVRLACRGFCPCARDRDPARSDRDPARGEPHAAPPTGPHRTHATRAPPRRQQRRMRNRQRPERRNFDDLEYDELWRRRKPEQEHNEVLPERALRRRPQESEGCALDKMANRLLDWFAVLMEEAGATAAPTRGFPGDCKPEVRWMFAHLDTDGDGLLSLKNLYSLRHDEREKCLRPFLSSCDPGSGYAAEDDTGPATSVVSAGPARSATSAGSAGPGGAGLGRAAWCSCLRRAVRPCAALARAHPAGRPGAYVPACDARGFYRPRQCHAALGVCWCVDAHGAELPGTRTKGAPACPRPPAPPQGAPADDEDGGGSGDNDLRF